MRMFIYAGVSNSGIISYEMMSQYQFSTIQIFSVQYEMHLSRVQDIQ
jgi:hypothetical protein